MKSKLLCLAAVVAAQTAMAQSVNIIERGGEYLMTDTGTVYTNIAPLDGSFTNLRGKLRLLEN